MHWVILTLGPGVDIELDNRGCLTSFLPFSKVGEC